VRASPDDVVVVRALPFVGAVLEELTIVGSAKDAVLRGRFVDGRSFEIPTSRARTRVEVVGMVAIETCGWDDVSMVVSYRALDQQRLVVYEASVDYVDESDDSWELDLRAYLDPRGERCARCAVASVCLRIRAEPSVG
jgi:hypothetical protein